MVSVSCRRIALVYKNLAAENRSVSHVGLGVCALNTARSLRGLSYRAEVWSCNSAGDITARLTQGLDSVSHVVIAAPWVPTVELQRLVGTHPDVEFSVISHSNFGFLAADPGAVRLLREGREIELGTHNLRIGGNCEKFTGAWSRMYGGPAMLCLPNLYDVSTIAPVGARVPWARGETLRIGVFGAQRPLKNMVTATAAAIELATSLRTDLEIWVSSGRNEGGTVASAAIAQLTDRLPTVKLVQTGRQSWPAFRDTVNRMHLVLAPSYTESFCIVAADAIAEGVACVVGEAIDWVPRDWIANVDDASSIARVGRHLLHDVHAVSTGQQALKTYVRNGALDWITYLGPA